MRCRTTVKITLLIQGDPDVALEVVDRILDNGTLQDEINDYDGDGAPLQVLSASCRRPLLGDRS